MPSYWHHFFFYKEFVKEKLAEGDEETLIAFAIADEPENSIEMGEGISPEIGSGTTVDTGTSGGTTNRVLQKATLKKGKTLRLMAEEHYGNREFWVYIYLENKGKISNPNRVPSGTVLLLPDKSNYSIDATNPQSVAKAKTLGDEVLKKF